MLLLGTMPYEYLYFSYEEKGFPGGASDKEPACQCRRCKRLGFNPWVRKTPEGGNGNHILAWGILAGCSPWGHKESDLPEHTAQHMGRKTCKVLLCSQMGRMLVKAISQSRDRAPSEAKTVITVGARSPHSPMSLLNQASELRVKQQWDTLGDPQEIDLHRPQCNGKMKIHGGNRH